MAKFNVVQKRRRAAIADRKRAMHGDPLTKKLKHNTTLQSVSGKRKRKLFKRWRREQKEAVEKGLITMQDVEMAAAAAAADDDDDHGSSKDYTTNKQPPPPPTIKFHVKKSPKLRARQFKARDKKNTRKSAKRLANAAANDAMEEE